MAYKLFNAKENYGIFSPSRDLEKIKQLLNNIYGCIPAGLQGKTGLNYRELFHKPEFAHSFALVEESVRLT